MAGTSLLTLLDDIAALLDDVAVLTKVATKKTVGVLGDDLALNAEQVAGMTADRELPVIWAVAKGSAVNKLILVPAAVLISAVAGWAITPLLMVGGAFLCFEGFEKVMHGVLHRAPTQAQRAERARGVAEPGVDAVDMMAFEAAKIRGAVRTDFILSAEVIVISLGAVAEAAFATRVMTLCVVAALMTVGVYGLVAGIVKLDDVGLHLSRRGGPLGALGRGILRGAPYMMKGLSIAGTAAMFLVGGDILIHGIPGAQALVGSITQASAAVPGLAWVVSALASALVGALTGAVVLTLVSGVRRAAGKRSP